MELSWGLGRTEPVAVGGSLASERAVPWGASSRPGCRERPLGLPVGAVGSGTVSGVSDPGPLVILTWAVRFKLKVATAPSSESLHVVAKP